MAKYSYTSGMEARGLNWLWVAVTPETALRPNTTGKAAQLIQTALTTAFGANYEVIILENYIVPSGTGTFFVALFVYNQNDTRRLPGDGIRFHDGAQDQAAKPLV